MHNGYIKFYRKIIDSEIYQMPPLYLRVFERLIIEANHQDTTIPFKDSPSGKKTVKRGERVTSLGQIANWVGWYERGIFKIPNKKTIKVILEWLGKAKMIGFLGNGQYTHYFVINYDTYQSEPATKVTVKKRSLDTNKNDKNDKNKYIVEFEKLWAKYPFKDGKKSAIKSFNARINSEEKLKEINKALDNYLAHLKANPWKRAKNGSTWFNNWEDWINFKGEEENDEWDI
jgi:hypothetical protein